MIIKNCKCYNSELLIYYVSTKHAICHRLCVTRPALCKTYLFFTKQKNEAFDMNLSTQRHVTKINNIT